jgi:CNT family concentrative nucleoside transporter
MDVFHALAGLAILVLLSWAISEDRRGVHWRLVASGIALMVALSAILLLVAPIRSFVFAANDALNALQDATRAGTSFVFGYLGGGPAPFTTTDPRNSFVIAFGALQLLIVVISL